MASNIRKNPVITANFVSGFHAGVSRKYPSIMLVFYLLLTMISCNSDLFPPDPSKYNDTRPRLVITFTGFNPGSRVYLRHWEGSRAYTYSSSYALSIDGSGRLLTEIVLSSKMASADVLAYVDQSGNNVLDAADFGTYQTSISINTAGIYTYLKIPYQASTLTAFNSATPLPVSGQKICIYMPTSKPAWTSSLVSSMPEYPDMNGTTLSLSDWFPVSIVGTTGITQNFPAISALGAGAYNETCVLDANSNGRFDSGETLSTLPAP